MKIKALIGGAIACAAFLTLGACSGGSGKDINELGNATRSDSLSNLLGQMYADDYWHMAQSDSATFAGSEAMKEYRRGIEKGMQLNSESDAYIQGLMTGVDIMRYSRDKLTKDFDVSINPKALLEGLDYGLNNDSSINMAEVQQLLNEMQTKLNIEKARRDRNESEAALNAYVAKNDCGAKHDNFYIKTLSAGEGAPLENGTIANISITAKDLTTGELISAGLPRQFRVGGSLAGIDARKLLGEDAKVGERVVVTTSALDFFGTRCSRFDVDPKSILSITISVDSAEAAE